MNQIKSEFNQALLQAWPFFYNNQLLGNISTQAECLKVLVIEELAKNRLRPVHYLSIQHPW